MAHATLATRSGRGTVQRVLDARADTLDFRDRMFEPTLIEVPTHIPLADYLAWKVPLLDQRSMTEQAAMSADFRAPRL